MFILFVTWKNSIGNIKKSGYKNQFFPAGSMDQFFYQILMVRNSWEKFELGIIRKPLKSSTKGMYQLSGKCREQKL